MNDEVLSKEGISSPNNENIEVLAGENETSHNLIMPSFDSDESAILNQRAKNMLDSKDYKLQNDKIKASLESNKELESAEKDNKDSIISNLALVFALVFACVFALRAVKLKKQTPQTPQNPLSSNTSANSSGDSNELNFDNAKGGIYGNF